MRRTYGWRRLEILAALVNGVALAGLAVWIFWDAVTRLRDAPTVSAGGVLVVGLAGIAVNGVAALVLLRWRRAPRTGARARST